MAAAKQKAGAKPAEAKPEHNGAGDDADVEPRIPRLTKERAKQPAEPREVILWHMGQSVLIDVITPTRATEIQEELAKVEEDEIKWCTLVSLVLLDPELSVADIVEARAGWSVGDWLTLRDAALDAIGWGGALREAQNMFRGPGD